MKTLAFHAVWGNRYIERFLKYVLPTQMTDGNLFALPEGSKLEIATRESDVDLILQSETIVACKARINVEVIGFPDLLFDHHANDKYSVLLKLQNEALNQSKQYEAIIFGYADAIWSDGAYKNSLKRLADGYDMVMCVGFNVNEKQVIDIIDKRFGNLPIDQRAIPPRDLAEICYNNLHIIARSRFWDHPHMNNYPSFLLWDVKGKGILARAFHLHPVIIKVRHSDPSFFLPFEVSLDEGFASRFIQQGTVPYVSTSSDEMFVCGLAGDIIEAHMYSYPLRPPNIADVIVFAERSASLPHRQFFEEPIHVIFSGTVNDFDWNQIRTQSDRICNSISRRLLLSDEVLDREDPIALAARRNRHLHGRRFQKKALVTATYIRNVDSSHLRDILIHYSGDTWAKVFVTMYRGWRYINRLMRSVARRFRGPRVKKENPLESSKKVYCKPLPLNYVLINTNTWQVINVALHLVHRTLRSEKKLKS